MIYNKWTPQIKTCTSSKKFLKNCQETGKKKKKKKKKKKRERNKIELKREIERLYTRKEIQDTAALFIL
jgi:hypothetical protein